MRRYATAILVVLAVLASAAPQRTFTLIRTLKVLDISVYDLKVSISAEELGQPITFNAKLHEQVADIKEDGSYVIASSQTDQHMFLDGVEQQGVQEDPPVMTIFTRSGLPIGVAGETATPNTLRLAIINAIVAPPKPVSVGSAWAIEVEANKETGAVSAEIKYRVTGIEKIGGREVLVVTVKGKELTGDNPASSDGTAWLDTTTFQIVKAVSTLKNAPIGFLLVNAKVEFLLTEE